jgi:hypothetical protein
MTFSFVQTQNCRKFIKRCYQLPLLIDFSLLNLLESEFGLVEIYEFSKFSSKAKDTFKISSDTTLQITGNLQENNIFFTVSKEKATYTILFEQLLRKWIDTNCDS